MQEESALSSHCSYDSGKNFHWDGIYVDIHASDYI